MSLGLIVLREALEHCFVVRSTTTLLHVAKHKQLILIGSARLAHNLCAVMIDCAKGRLDAAGNPRRLPDG